MERTSEQHIIGNAWAQFGAAHWVDKAGPRKWTVAGELSCSGGPRPFATKRAAVEYAERQIHSILHPTHSHTTFGQEA